MPDTVTAEQIQTRLTEVRTAISRIVNRSLTSEDLGAKTITYEHKGNLKDLRELEKDLLQEFSRLERGGGMRVRYGAVR